MVIWSIVIGMLPIRKIKPKIVALTSYYGKTFVKVSEKKADSSIDWIIKQINKASLTEQSPIKNIAPGMVFDNNFKAPYIYSALSSQYKMFSVGQYHFNFDYTDRTALFDDATVSAVETQGRVIAGFTDRHEPIVVDENNEFYIYDSKQQWTPIGDIYTILQLDPQDAPVDFTEVRIYSKSIPVIVVLSYFMGFHNALKLIKAQYRVVEGRLFKELKRDEFAIRFKDVSYIFNRKDRVTSMIVAGLLQFEKEVKRYEVSVFDKKDIYFNLLQTKEIGSVYMRELELTNQLFVDAITESILRDMGEPVTFLGLLIRATEMLQTYHHPDSQDMSAMRIRGYERIPGAIYGQIAASIRQFRNRNIAGRSKVDISPYQVFQTIMKDPSIKLPEDINPIQNLKEQEVVTYVGEGGRSKDSINKASRAYHPKDIGIVSEATVDSSDVGVNAYLSANPKFSNLRGLPDFNGPISATNLLSTTALLSPSSDKDD